MHPSRAFARLRPRTVSRAWRILGAVVPLFLIHLAVPHAMAADGAAVVELYVSEGCSSCPPAEALAAELVEQAATTHARLFYLEFPVDYWDYLGWKDPFARPEYAERQEAWARRLGLKQVGTPQAIVGGITAILGSDGAALRAGIAAANARSNPVVVTPTAHWAPDGLHVAVQLTHAPSGALVIVALTESSLSSAIHAGENNGRTLVHNDVVRAFTELPVTGDLADIHLTAPAHLVRDRSAVTVVVEDGASCAVLGAERIQIRN
jgi:hypothetical protein